MTLPAGDVADDTDHPVAAVGVDREPRRREQHGDRLARRRHHAGLTVPFERDVRAVERAGPVREQVADRPADDTLARAADQRRRGGVDPLDSPVLGDDEQRLAHRVEHVVEEARRLDEPTDAPVARPDDEQDEDRPEEEHGSRHRYQRRRVADADEDDSAEVAQHEKEHQSEQQSPRPLDAVAAERLEEPPSADRRVTHDDSAGEEQGDCRHGQGVETRNVEEV
nr:hypothetical protein [Salinigranum rubrum]